VDGFEQCSHEFPPPGLQGNVCPLYLIIPRQAGILKLAKPTNSIPAIQIAAVPV
jgi:hypothetical protein